MEHDLAGQDELRNRSGAIEVDQGVFESIKVFKSGALDAVEHYAGLQGVKTVREGGLGAGYPLRSDRGPQLQKNVSGGAMLLDVDPEDWSSGPCLMKRMNQQLSLADAASTRDDNGTS